jgi:hypothetical protein
MKSLLQNRNSAQRQDRTSNVTVRWSGTVAVCRPIVNRRSRFVSVLFAVLMAPLLAQPREVIQESSVREMAGQAAREAKGDATELVLALDRRVRGRWGDFESFPVSIVRSDDLLVSLTAPYMSFRNSVIDMLRTGRPINRAVWVNAVIVAVTPQRLGGPDIESVVVSRNGRPVEPVKSSLRPMRFSSGTGEEGVLHAGDISFPTATFSTGARVAVTLTPHLSDPIVRTFTDYELSTLK